MQKSITKQCILLLVIGFAKPFPGKTEIPESPDDAYYRFLAAKSAKSGVNGVCVSLEQKGGLSYTLASQAGR